LVAWIVFNKSNFLQKKTQFREIYSMANDFRESDLLGQVILWAMILGNRILLDVRHSVKLYSELKIGHKKLKISDI
jgi:hypothetical protein